MGNDVSIQHPYKIGERIQIRSSIIVEEHDAFLLSTALFALDDEINEMGRDYSLVPQGIILINGSESFTYFESGTLGYALPLIIIPLGKIREHKLTDLSILAIYLEEFFHHFLMISDEEEVKIKVVERLNKTVNFKVEFNDIYKNDWKLGYPELYGNENDEN